ncbi:plasmid mobilization protein [Flavobacterium collinsii]|uniref:plasmid mobilization protein n=1 Tax=Flavobacterium collinsii TaxID=1114861 RepID=UPI0027E50DC6|nr:plasmid mobilization relaxosome protein MobC [Flavobacterium collinsii]
MMEEENKNRTRWLHLRLTSAEYEILQKQFGKSNCRKLSDYARKNLLQKPMVLKYRNESLDELMREFIMLRKDLNGIGNNFNQAVKKLHTLVQISEFKHWVTVYEIEKKVLFNSVDKIKKNIENLSKKWLQS